jgi:hypothetical protein
MQSSMGKVKTSELFDIATFVLFIGHSGRAAGRCAASDFQTRVGVGLIFRGDSGGYLWTPTSKF